MGNVLVVVLAVLGGACLAAGLAVFVIVRRKFLALDAYERGFRNVLIERKSGACCVGWARAAFVRAYRDMPGKDSVLELQTAKGKKLLRYCDIMFLEEVAGKSWRAEFFP